ncbi:hypothetical protein EniLVp02_0225 [Vibrio phage EniLVp02]
MPKLVIKTFSLNGVDYKSAPKGSSWCVGCVFRHDPLCDVAPDCSGLIFVPVEDTNKPQENPNA